jgi:transcriptional regulator with XRE-family HTH domain
MDGQERSFRIDAFRNRLTEVMAQANINRARLAQAIGVDRSTLSQLLSPENERLPRVETLVSIAAKLQISVDWLLGLSEDASLGAEILGESLQFTPSLPLPSDESLRRWHREAIGSKIRYVPANLPDLVKTRATLIHEYAGFEAVTTQQVEETTAERLHSATLPGTDLEICMSLQTLHAFALAEGIWKGMQVDDRRAQLVEFANVADQLYPRVRIHIFDQQHQFATPYTIFGAQRASIYLGQMYFVFNTPEHVQTLTGHFDNLVRAAVIHSHECADRINDLARSL